VIGCLKCENWLKSETAKFQEIYDKFCKEKEAHLQALKGTLFTDFLGLIFLDLFPNC
jgi:hypothetical protein